MVLTGRHAGSGLPTNNAGGEYQRNRSRTQDPNHSPLAVASRHRFIVRADARRLAHPHGKPSAPRKRGPNNQRFPANRSAASAGN